MGSHMQQQQQPQPHSLPPNMGIPGSGMMHQQHQPHPQHPQHQQHQPHPPPPQHMHNQYNFVEEQYIPPPSDQGEFSFDFGSGQSSLANALRIQPPLPRQSRRSGRQTTNFSASQQSQQPQPPPMAPPHLVVPPMPDTTAGYTQQGQFSVQMEGEPPSGEGFFYHQNLSHEVLSSTSPSGAESSQPHQTFTFAPYSPDHLTAGSATYTPNSEFNTLPSSMSPSSWTGTDDGQTQTFSQNANSQQQQQSGGASGSSQSAAASAAAAAQQQGGVISSSPTQLVTSQSAGKSKERRTQPSGARGRGGKSVRGQKRPRTSGQSLLESDTQSDDDDGFGSSMNMTVSVPPVRGSDTMPTRLCVYIIHFFLSLFLSFLSLSFLLSLSLFFPLYIR